MDKHSFPNGKRLVRDTLKPDDNLHYEQFQDGTINEYENEPPFEIPSKWVWCNLGMLFSHNTGKALNASKTDGASLTYITTSNVYWNSFELGNLKIMPFTDSEIEKCTVKKGDLLVCEGGDIGRAAIWQFENEIRIQNHRHRLRPYDRIYTKFYYYIMYLYKSNGRINGNGIGLQGLSSNALHNIIVPVPPVEEQKRIVDSIDSVLSLIEQIESHKQKLSSQIDNIKSKILDLSIRGKLVPQDPNDEPASVLLERIRAEKEELIKQGKIKRDKKESIIFKGDDNSYYRTINSKTELLQIGYDYELPDGWEFITVGEYSKKVTDQVASGSFAALRENVKSLKTPDYAIMVKTADFSNGFTKNLTYTDKHGYEFLENSNLFGGELILNNIGSIGKVFIVPKLDHKMTLAPNSIMIRLNSEEYRDYLYYFFSSPLGYSALMSISSGAAVTKFNKTDLKNLVIPIPPLVEQKRIVDEIEKIFAILDDIANQVA